MSESNGAPHPASAANEDIWLKFETETGATIFVNARLARTIGASIGGRSLIKFDHTHTVIVQGEPAEVVARLKG